MEPEAVQSNALFFWGGGGSLTSAQCNADVVRRLWQVFFFNLSIFFFLKMLSSLTAFLTVLLLSWVIESNKVCNSGLLFSFMCKCFFFFFFQTVMFYTCAWKYDMRSNIQFFSFISTIYLNVNTRLKKTKTKKNVSVHPALHGQFHQHALFFLFSLAF